MKSVANNAVIKESVYIETNDYIIKGFISATPSQFANNSNNRMLSNILNSNRDFIAIENCKIEHKGISVKKEVEYVEFIQINKSSILLLKPLDNAEL